MSGWLDDATQGDATFRPEQLRTIRRALTALAVLGSGSMLGVALSPYLVTHMPLLLIALSPLGRHLVLVAPIVDPFAFVIVSVVRRLLFYGASFELGRGLGPAGFGWLEARAARFSRFVRWLEGIFARASRLVVLGFAGPTVSALAGISGMPVRVFLPLATLSLVVRVLLILALGELAREPIEQLLAWIDEWWRPATAVMVIGVGIYQWVRVRRSKRVPPERHPADDSAEPDRELG